MSGVRGRFGSLGLVIAVALVSLSWASSAAAETVDGTFDGIGRLPADEVVDLQVLGRGGVPASGVDSVALNVTVTNPFFAGYLTVWPTGQTRPTASNLNFVRAQTVPNMVIVPVGIGGKVSLYLYGGSSDVVIDVLGWFPVGGGFTGLTPARLLDTRAEGETIDGTSKGGGVLSGGSTIDLPVRGRGGVPASGAGSVVLNVTLVSPTDATYLTVWPSGVARPTASNLNVAAGETRPNLVIVPLGAARDVSLYLYSGAAHVAVDVLGWFPTGGAFTGLTPARLMDTRRDGVTFDGVMRSTGALVGGSTVDLPVAGRGGVPTGPLLSVALNVTLTNPSQAAFLTVWPTGATRPTASNLNVVPGQTAPNMVLVPLGADGRVSLFLNRGSADVVVDVLGYVTGSSAFVGLSPQRLLETRGNAGFVPLPPSVSLGPLVFDGSYLWSNNSDGRLARIDPASGQMELVSVPGRSVHWPTLAVDGQYLWVRGDQPREVIRFEPATGRTRSVVLPFGMNGNERPAVDGRFVWFGNRYAITRVDRASGAMRVFQVPQDLLAGDLDPIAIGDVVFDGRYLWFGARVFGTDLGRFDTVTGRFAAVPLPAGQRGTEPVIAFDGRRVYTLTFFVGPDGERKALSWFDGATGQSGTIVLPAEVQFGGALTATGSSIWISTFSVGKLVKVDLASGRTTVFDGEALIDPRDALALPIGLLVQLNDGSRLWAAAPMNAGLAYFPADL